MLSKTTEYAIRALIYLESVTKKGHKAGVEEVAQAIDSPKAFTAKVLQKLARAGLITSQKGPAGGFFLPEHQQAIYLIEVIKAIEGNHVFQRCGLGLEMCNDHEPCPIHDQYRGIRDSFRDLMARETIQNLAVKLELGEVHLKHLAG